jgi:outer membrane lipoprotein-sorting protein
MALNPPFTIRVLKPEDALAETMNEMRIWLDKHKVRPVQFKIAMTGMPGIALDIRFRKETEAVLFARVFSPSS